MNFDTGTRRLLSGDVRTSASLNGLQSVELQQKMLGVSKPIFAHLDLASRQQDQKAMFMVVLQTKKNGARLPASSRSRETVDMQEKRGRQAWQLLGFIQVFDRRQVGLKKEGEDGE
jgi:hypothetical protein